MDFQTFERHIKCKNLKQNIGLSVKGIQIAVNYWVKNGHKVVCFLPEYLFDYEQVNKRKAEKKFG